MHRSWSARRARLLRRDDAGAVAVEFALLLPLLLLLVLGTIQYGTYFYSRQGGADVARDAARRAAVGDPAACADFTATIDAGIAGIAGASDAQIVQRTYEPGTGNSTGTVLPGDEITVRVQFPSFDMNLPFVPVPDDATVDVTVSTRVEYVPTQPEECP